MLIPHKGHTDTIQVYSVTVMTHVKALQAGHSSQGTSEPITPALLLSADFQKAFDSLEWDFVDCCLQLLNLGPSLRKWANIFYTNITTRVGNNGWVTNFFFILPEDHAKAVPFHHMFS